MVNVQPGHATLDLAGAFCTRPQQEVSLITEHTELSRGDLPGPTPKDSEGSNS